MKKIMVSIIISLVCTTLFSQDWIRYIPEPADSHFVLVIDRSGSMSGQPLADAKEAAIDFVERVRPGDQVAIVSFETKVHYDQAFTDDKEQLISVINSLEVEGLTAFYDGLAKAIQLLKYRQGSRAIVFLTDGNDSSSSFRVRDIAQMNIGEAVQCYGIGLGDIDHRTIERVSRAVKGEYRRASTSGQLKGLYRDLQDSYYNFDPAETGSLSITSVPSGVPVLVNGENLGETPVALSRQLASTADVVVQFQKKDWENPVEIKEGFRGIVRAREDSLMPDLTIETMPYNSAVFIDDTYVGLSSRFPSQGDDHSGQLRIENISPGSHRIRIVAVPDVELSSSQVYEFDFNLKNMSAYMVVKTFMRKVDIEYNNGQKEQIGSGLNPGEIDINDRLNRMNEMLAR